MIEAAEAYAIVVGRLLQFTGVLVLFGSSLFYLYGLKDGAYLGAQDWRRKIVRVATLSGLAGVVIWFVALTASVSDPPSDAFNPAVLSSMATDTRFGRICLLRIALLAACLIAMTVLRANRMLWSLLALSSGIVVASFAWTGHGVKDDGAVGLIHLSADVFHLLAGGVWLGALVPLSVLIFQAIRSAKLSPAMTSYEALERFSGVGPAIVAVLLLSGFINSWFLIGWNPSALWTSIYGAALTIKILFFGLMLLLAAHNRYRLAPVLARALRMDDDSSQAALAAFRKSLFIETGLGFLVLAAVAFLGTLEPPMSDAL